MPGDILKTVPAGQGLACYAIVADHSHLSNLQARNAKCQKLKSVASGGNSPYNKNDVLTKETTKKGRIVKRIVVPATLRESAMTIFHDNSGHMGTEKTKELILRKYWWPTLLKDVRRYVKSCHMCQTIYARTTLSKGCLSVNECKYSTLLNCHIQRSSNLYRTHIVFFSYGNTILEEVEPWLIHVAGPDGLLSATSPTFAQLPPAWLCHEKDTVLVFHLNLVSTISTFCTSHV